MFSTLTPLGCALLSTQLFSVVADGRPRYAKAVSDFVHVQAGIDKLSYGYTNLGHERMFSDSSVGMLLACVAQQMVAREGIGGRMAILCRPRSGMV